MNIWIKKKTVLKKQIYFKNTLPTLSRWAATSHKSRRYYYSEVQCWWSPLWKLCTTHSEGWVESVTSLLQREAWNALSLLSTDISSTAFEHRA
jgi:hypothetical protein